MKFSLKTLVAAVAMAAAASGAHADIQAGNTGNGELFFNIWDANGSYTRGLVNRVDSFETALAAVGNIDLSWAADATFTSFLAGTVGGTRSGTLLWNIVANDTSGANRLLTTYTPPEQTVTKADNVIRTTGAAVTTFISAVNPLMAGGVLSGNSLAVDSGSTAYAGKPATFGENIAGILDFSTAGTLANNSFANGLGFMRINAAAGGTLPSVYNEYLDGTTPVNAYLDANNTLHLQALAAVPEPESYAMLLAGLGMLGFMARRRLNNRV